MNQQYNSNLASRRLHGLYATMVGVAGMGAAVHVALVGFFAAIGAMQLAALNVASSLAWSYCFYAVRRGDTQVAVPLALAEVYVHAVLCMAVLGLAPGFQHYLWAAIPFIMFNKRWSPGAMAAIAGAFAVTYVSGSLWAGEVEYSYAFPLLVPYLRIVNTLVAFAALTLACLYFRNAAQMSLDRLRDLANTDPLTGLYNRRRVESLGNPIAGLPEVGATLTIALGDIDCFKDINDRYGHACGDAVICEVADRLRRRLRKTDFVARWGGDEFLVVMPDSDAQAAKAIIEGICAEIAEAPVCCGEIRVPVSMTFGVAMHRAADGMDAGVKRADHALYRGKAAGRNCVMVAA